MNEMFELRRENHVHENHRNAERDEKIHPGFLKRFGAPGEDHVITRRHVEVRRDAFHVGNGFAEGIVIDVRRYGHLALSLETFDLIWSARFLDSQKIRELHQVIASTSRDQSALDRSADTHGDLFQRFLGFAVLRASAQPYIVLVVRLFVGAHDFPADQRA